MKWMESESNGKEAELFEEKLVSLLSNCFVTSTKSQKSREERYGQIITKLEHQKSTMGCGIHFCKWLDLLRCHQFFVNSSDHMLHELPTVHFPVINRDVTSQSTASELTCEETYGLRYAAGYVPRSLKKKLPKSSNPLKKDLLLCLDSLIITDQEDIIDDSKQWIDLIDRGGLAKVTNDCYELFVAMEKELRKHLSIDKAPKMIDREAIKQAIIENEEVQFFWHIISGEWEEESSVSLLNMIAAEWLKICGFSFAGAWMEKYKCEKQLMTQKSKGLRKQLATFKSAK